MPAPYGAVNGSFRDPTPAGQPAVVEPQIHLRSTTGRARKRRMALQDDDHHTYLWGSSEESEMNGDAALSDEEFQLPGGYNEQAQMIPAVRA